VLVNGNTGEIVGDRPVSRTRVVLAVAIGVLIVLVIVVLIVALR
jgi:ABC-type transport system involved in multi-copper enzyme maturation permease subunit